LQIQLKALLLCIFKKVAETIKPGETKLIWVETPSNPTLKVSDIAAISAIAKKNEAILVVDNTFLTSYFQVKLINIFYFKQWTLYSNIFLQMWMDKNHKWNFQFICSLSPFDLSWYFSSEELWQISPSWLTNHKE